MGHRENHAVYRLNYGNSQLFLSKTMNGRLSEAFSEDMDLVQLKSCGRGSEYYQSTARCLSNFTKMEVRLVNYEYNDCKFTIHSASKRIIF